MRIIKNGIFIVHSLEARTYNLTVDVPFNDTDFRELGPAVAEALKRNTSILAFSILGHIEEEVAVALAEALH